MLDHASDHWIVVNRLWATKRNETVCPEEAVCEDCERDVTIENNAGGVCVMGRCEKVLTSALKNNFNDGVDDDRHVELHEKSMALRNNLYSTLILFGILFELLY